jgi:hypothetical protein
VPVALDAVGDEELGTIVSPHLALGPCCRVCPAAGARRRRNGSRCDKLDLGSGRSRFARQACIGIIHGKIYRDRHALRRPGLR